MWVVSAELVQLAMGSRTPHADEKYEKPYFVSYVSLSAFSICLLGFVRRSWRRTLRLPPRSDDGFVLLEDIPPGDDAHGDPADDTAEAQFNAKQVFGIALAMAPLFFLSDWVYTLGLKMTSVASSSTINALTGLFTLGIGAMMNVERFSRSKLLAAIITIAGVAIISAQDEKKEGAESLWGDLVNILAAIIYSLYTTVLKFKSGPPGALDVSMLFGMIGFVVMVGGTPGFAILDILGWETFELPPPRVAWMLFLNAWVGTVVSDFLWAKSIVLTTPMIGTLALSLSVPLSVVLDYFLRGVEFSVMYLVGATLVFAGFIAVNLDEMRERRRTGVDTSAGGAGEEG